MDIVVDMRDRWAYKRIMTSKISTDIQLGKQLIKQ